MSQLSDINNQLTNLYRLPAKKRLDAIINHETPMKLVHAMDATQLLLCIRGVGAESSLELVEMMLPEQTQALLDLAIWRRDELDTASAGHYLSMLFAAELDTAVAQMYGLDIELLGYMFKAVSHIYDTTLNEDPESLSTLYSTSPDNRFIICFSEKARDQALTQALHSFLEAMYSRNLPFILRLLESLRYELPADLEEKSLHFRNQRLLDLGILPRDERLEFFAPIALKDIRAMASPSSSLALNSTNHIVVKNIVNDEYAFLQSALKNLPDEHKQIFWESLRHVIINMHASLSGDFGDEDAMISSAEYVKFLLELGLMQICQGHIGHAHDAVVKTKPKYLCRLGRTALVTMRARLVQALKSDFSLFGPDFINVDSPLREVARALCLAEPRYYEGLLDPKKLTCRHFMSISEVNATMKAINEILFRAYFTENLKPKDKSAHSLSHATMVARALVNQFVGKTNPLDDVLVHELNQLQGSQGMLSAEFVQHARHFGEVMAQEISEKANITPTQSQEKACALINAILAQLEQNPSLLLTA